MEALDGQLITNRLDLTGKEVNGECAAMTVGDPAVPIPTQVSGTPGNFSTDMPDVSTATVDNGSIIGA